MKKIFTIFFILSLTVTLMSFGAGKEKSQFMKILDKLKKSNTTDVYGPTSVAGVRGDNVYEQNKNQMKHDLYWEQ